MNAFINCKVCGKKLTGRQSMFCSHKCKNKVHQSYDAQKERAIERKLYFISALGGKCRECGYNENIAALSFHHKSGKEYKLDSRSLSNRGLQTMKDEIAKCDLLCSNCHMKLHNPSLDLAKLSIEPTALTTELQAPKCATNSKEIIPKKSMFWKEFAQKLTDINIQPDQTIVLGVSGGIDSVVMLDLFAKVHPKDKLILAHVNHGFRHESDSDEKFVKSLATKYGIHFTSKKIAPYKKHSHILQNVRMSSNLEEYFRDERRKFLLSVTRLQGPSLLALAHNADDRAETMIMNLVRGSGPAGLAGMKNSDGQIIRPLLSSARAEIEAYAKQNKLEWHEDITNQDTGYSRNYIRHQILPLLSRLNPEYLANIGRSSEIQREIDSYLKKKAASLTKQLHENAVVSKDIPKPILYEAFAQMYEQVRGNRKDLSVAHLLAVEELTSDTTGTKTLDLPGDITARRRYNHLDFVLKMRDNIPPVTSLTRLSVGCYQFGEWKVKITEFDDSSHLSRHSEHTKNLGLDPSCGQDDDNKLANDKWCVNLDSLNDLQVRTVKPGDRIQPKGMKGHKKLQDLFVDAKIDRIQRQNYPILAKESNDELFWVPDLAISEALTTKKSKYRISISKGNSNETN